jgi:transglutaminase-like putative cysteine protease
MRYAITHVTRFVYDAPVSESHMEVRMQPRTGPGQTCLHYELQVEPRARPHAFHDHLANAVDYFSVPGRHQSLTITARADVQVDRPRELPASLPSDAWREVDEWSRQDAHWDLRQPSSFAVWTPALTAYAESIPAASARSMDPLSTVRTITSAVHRDFEYSPNSTQVHSSIDEPLGSRRGVCQDLSHITVALLRRLDLPARYVSGYLAPPINDVDPGPVSSATHAWVEVLLPQLGWIGFDPTNDTEAGERHVVVAIGRDYADVPPARGVVKGKAGSTLTVSVVITPADVPHAPHVGHTASSSTTATHPPAGNSPHSLQQQQQQQQQ